MYIKRKVFSVNDQKEFARKDYAGLNETQAKVLKGKRSEYAKELHKVHRNTQKGINNSVEQVENLSKLSTKNKIKAGGVISNVDSTSFRGSDMKTNKDFGKFHQKNVTELHLKEADKAANLMRESVKKSIPAENVSTALQKLPEKAPKKSIPSKALKLSKNNKIALGVGAGLAATGIGVYAYKRNKKKNKS